MLVTRNDSKDAEKYRVKVEMSSTLTTDLFLLVDLEFPDKIQDPPLKWKLS